MSTTNSLDIARLGRDGRLREVAATLAEGLLRTRASNIAPTRSDCTEGEFGLGFSGEQRVHANPSMTNGERA